MIRASDARLSFEHRPRRGRGGRLVSLTPLIDVVFILLLFFMLASNFANPHAIQLASPAASGHSSSAATGALLVNVRVTGIRVAGQPLTLEQLRQRAAKLNRTRPDFKVLVHPGTGVNLQQTVQVLDTLSQAGVRNLRLMGDSDSE